MSPIEQLKEKVKALYEAKNPNREVWADWLYQNHVLIVARIADELTEKFGARANLATAASLLHDIADAIMPRHTANHAEESLKIAHELLTASGFSSEEIQIVKDGIIHHSCRGEDKPQTLEGKIMATADAVAHLQTDFYNYAITMQRKVGKSDEEIKQWILPKIDRDYNKKIFFDEVRQEVTTDYQRLKKQFTEL